MTTQAQIDNYTMGALAFMPSLDKDQITAMAMLHFDTFYDDTKPMVEKALQSIHKSEEALNDS